MEENKDLTALLEKIEASTRKQAKYARWQCLFSTVAAVFCAVALVAVVRLLPLAANLTQQAGTVLQDVHQVSSQLAMADWEGLISDLETVSSQMAQADLGSVVEEVNSLVSTSQTGLESALEKLNSIDFETLNKAIDDLSQVVEPLANMFGKFS